MTAVTSNNYDVELLLAAAVPYGTDLVRGAGEQAATNLSANFAQDIVEIGGTVTAERRLTSRVMNNMQRATLSIADAHSGCRAKRCRVCDGIRVALVELVAYRTTESTTTT